MLSGTGITNSREGKSHGDLFITVLSRLYEVLDGPERWPIFLEQLGGVLRARFVCLSVVDVHRVEFSAVHAWGLTRDELIEYTTKWRDPWGARVAISVIQPDKVTASDELCTDEELESTEVYRSFLGPRGIHYGAAMVIEKSTRRQVLLSFGRPKEFGRVGNREKLLLNSVGPHIRRVLRAQANSSAADRLSRAGVALFEYLNAGIAVLARDGRILVSNGLWAEAVAGLRSVRDHNGHLAFKDAIVQSQLSRLLSTSNPNPAAWTTSIREPHLTLPRLLLMLPLAPPSEGAPAVDEPAVALLVVDLHRLPVLDEGVARSCFGLSGAEAAVATHLVRGEALSEIATSLSVSHHTVRSHIKSIFAKTGTRRQADLLSLLVRSCVWPEKAGNAR